MLARVHGVRDTDLGGNLALSTFSQSSRLSDMALPCPNCRRSTPAYAIWCPACGTLTDRRGATMIAAVGVVACLALALSVVAISLAMR